MWIIKIIFLNLTQVPEGILQSLVWVVVCLIVVQQNCLCSIANCFVKTQTKIHLQAFLNRNSSNNTAQNKNLSPHSSNNPLSKCFVLGKIWSYLSMELGNQSEANVLFSFKPRFWALKISKHQKSPYQALLSSYLFAC